VCEQKTPQSRIGENEKTGQKSSARFARTDARLADNGPLRRAPDSPGWAAQLFRLPQTISVFGFDFVVFDSLDFI
jgi:hypothetical protein